jgi:MoaA/NifB/PqqE/SkfB family radical SAM enzyme
MKKLEIPIHLQIETVRGCNAKCVMCPLNYAEDVLKVKKGRMTEENFKKIIDKFLPYVSKIKFVSLIGIGEALLDKGLGKKIKYLKKCNFKNIAIATNAHLLNEEKQKELLESGIDTIICSVDGINKKTHESIRLNTNFEKVIRNIQSCIEKRDKGKYKTRFLIRMIRQQLNYQQWPKYVKYWEKYIDRKKRDDIIAFDVHNWGGTRVKEENIDYTIPCPFILEKIFIHFNGNVSLCGCSADILNNIILGNALTEDPIAIYNNKITRYHREMHKKGLRSYLFLCRGCNIPDQRRKRILSTARQ